MWLLLACLAAGLIGVSTILSKLGIRDTDPYVTGAVTNTVLLAAFAGTAWYTGAFAQTAEMGVGTWCSVCASGAVLSVSWIFYFLGLKGGSVSVFLAIQSLTVIVSTALCAVVIGETVTLWMYVGTGMILLGTVLMMDRQELAALCDRDLFHSDRRWILFSALSALFASVSYVIVKADTAPIDTNVTGTYRYCIVVAFLWALLLGRGKAPACRGIPGKTWLCILLGAAASGAGHVLVYRALYLGKAAVIMTIYRMGMVISIILSRLFLHEKLRKKGWVGLALLAAGVVLFAVGR